jgi:hypothetical protein
MSSCVNWAFFLTSGPLLNASETSVLKAQECQKKAQFTQERAEYNVFLFVLTSCDIYQNLFTQEKILKF